MKAPGTTKSFVSAAILSILLAAGCSQRLGELKADLRNGSGEKRVKALRELKTSCAPDDEALGLVKAAAKDADAKVASAALDAAGGIFKNSRDDLPPGGGDTIFQCLLDGMKDGRDDVKAAARGAFLDAADSAATDRDYKLAIAAIKALGQIFEKNKESLDAATKARILDAIWKAAYDKRQALKVTAKDALDPIFLSRDPVAMEHKNPRVRAWAANVLGSARDEEAVPQLIKMLGDEQGEVRAQAAQALARIGDKAAIAPLENALKSEKIIGVAAAMSNAIQFLKEGGAKEK